MNPRLAVLSDIHGNLPALEAVLADAQQFEPLAAVLIAGDIITPLCHEGVSRQLREIGAVMIQGNGEQGLLEMKNRTAPEYYWTAKQFAITRWGYTHTSTADMEFVCGLPEQRVFHLPGTDPVRIVHGSPRGVKEGIHPEVNPGKLAEVLELVGEPVVIFGHTHRPWQMQVGRQLALNPGAVCGPLNGQVGAQYAILEWNGSAWKAVLRCVSYNLGLITQMFISSGLLETGYLAKSFLASILTARNVARDFLHHACGLSRQAGFGSLPYIPDDIWDYAGATFPWNGNHD